MIEQDSLCYNTNRHRPTIAPISDDIIPSSDLVSSSLVATRQAVTVNNQQRQGYSKYLFPNLELMIRSCIYRI